MRLQTLLCCALALAGTGGTRVQAEDARAIEALTASRKAIGGNKLESLKTFSLEAALERNINEMRLDADIEILLELPDKYVRSDTSSGMMNRSMTSGFNGQTVIRPSNVTMAGGGMMIRMGGPGGPLLPGEKPSPEDQAKIDQQMLRSSRADISRLMLGWFAMAHPSLGAEYTYAGEAESPDGKAFVVDVRNGDGFTARLFIDQDSKLPLMVSYRAPQPRVIVQRAPARTADGAQHATQTPRRREMTDEERQRLRADAEKQLKVLPTQPPEMADFSLYFEEWRDVDGVKFPHKIRRAMGGSTHEEWTINKVKVNPKIDPKRFDG